MTANAIRIGVDIGGTFTDVALEHPGGLATAKVLTDYTHPEQAILEAMDLAAGQAGIALSDIRQEIHGTCPRSRTKSKWSKP